jgi:CRISPR-associated protein Cmr3
MKLFLEPMDVWLFRDGRPFDAGSDHRAESLFPPPPSVIQGALRSYHLVVKGIDLCDKAAIEATVGTSTRYPPGFRVLGPFIARLVEDRLPLYFPLPADAFKDGDRFLALCPKMPPAELQAGIPTPMWLLPEKEPEKFEERVWVSLTALLEYLERGELKADDAAYSSGYLARPGDLYIRENRMGIRLRPDTRTTEEGALYEVEFIRPKPDVGLFVEVHGLDGWPLEGFMRFGGEGHGARFRQIDAPDWPPPLDPLPERFKVYFATLAYFEEGWQPRNGDWGQFFEGVVELQAAAIGRYIALGGYDLARDFHKPARRYLPPGSVYFFTAKGKARLKSETITEDGAEIGFGQILIGRW